MPCARFVLPCVLLHTAVLLPCQTWIESIDAGDRLATAQVPAGSSNLTQIQGSLGGGAPGSDCVDIYLIQIFDTTTFQASTVGGAAFDTQLFLFDQDGIGVTHDDDAPTGGSQSRITGQFLVAPGRYYLAVTKHNIDPEAYGYGNIWNDAPRNVERIPDSFGKFDPLYQWSGSRTSPGGSYTISLTGVAFPPRQVLLPGNHHLSEGAGHTSGSPEYWRSAPTGHFQILYEGSHFTDAGVTGPVTITRLQMRGQDTVQNRGGQIYANVNLRVADTTLTANSIGTSFATNLLPATTAAGLAALIAFKTVKPCAGTAPNNYAFDLDLQALGIPFVFDPLGARPNLLVDILWTSAGPGPNGTNTIPVQDTTGGPAVVRGRGLTATNSTALSGVLRDPPVLDVEFVGAPLAGADVLRPARVESMGAACGGSPSALYQLFPHNQRFDLANMGMTWTPDTYPSPNYYTVTPGAPPVDPTQLNPSPNSTAENSSVTLALASPFSYPGGSTNLIRMDENGFVQLTTAAASAPWTPTLAKWLGATGEGPRFAPFWHDFSCGRNTMTHANSGLHVRNAPGGTCYCTWYQVGRFATEPAPGGQSVNTMQMSLNPNTGVVEFRFGTMSEIWGSSNGGSVAGITGFTRGQIGGVASKDPGSIDLSRELPTTTGVGDVAGNMILSAVDVVPAVPLHIPGRMFPGQQIRWNVTNIPPNTTFGLQLLDLGVSRPGLALPGIAPPECGLSTSLNPVIHEVFVLPGSSVSGTVPFTVPPGFDGTPVYAQFAALDLNSTNSFLRFTQALAHILGKQ